MCKLMENYVRIMTKKIIEWFVVLELLHIIESKN